MSRMNNETSTFLSGDLACAATLYTPSTSAGPSQHPAILMVHGWGGIQALLVEPFIEGFVAAGYAVMTFDYSSWGDSQGQPRHVINPWKRVREAELALAHLQQQTQVDADHIVLWGTSFGGGHVVELAAEHTNLQGAIAQVPMLDGRKAVAAVPFPRLLRFGVSIAADLLAIKSTVYIPVVAPTGEYASMDRDGAYAALNAYEVQHNKSLDNRVAARSLLTMGFYRPLKKLARVKVPMLLIGATRDSVAPFTPKDIESLNNSNLQIRTLDANHFEPYAEPALSQNLAYQLAFLETLKEA